LAARGLDVRHVDLGKRFNADAREYFGLQMLTAAGAMYGVVIRKPPMPSAGSTVAHDSARSAGTPTNWAS
jgi:hypothetical protein